MAMSIYLFQQNPSSIHIFIQSSMNFVPLVGQELPTLPEHLSSLPVFSDVRVTRSLVVYVLLIVVCTFILFRRATLVTNPVVTQAFDRWTLISPCLPRGTYFQG